MKAEVVLILSAYVEYLRGWGDGDGTETEGDSRIACKGIFFSLVIFDKDNGSLKLQGMVWPKLTLLVCKFVKTKLEFVGKSLLGKFDGIDISGSPTDVEFVAVVVTVRESKERRLLNLSWSPLPPLKSGDVGKKDESILEYAMGVTVGGERVSSCKCSNIEADWEENK